MKYYVEIRRDGRVLTKALIPEEFWDDFDEELAKLLERFEERSSV